MAYCTPDDVSQISGEPVDGDLETSLTIWLEIIATVIDEWLTNAGMKPEDVSDDKKKYVSMLMGQQALYTFGVDPTLVSFSETSGDTSESKTISSSNLSAQRFLGITPLYKLILGIKNRGFGNLRVETTWR